MVRKTSLCATFRNPRDSLTSHHSVKHAILRSPSTILVSHRHSNTTVRNPNESPPLQYVSHPSLLLSIPTVTTFLFGTKEKRHPLHLFAQREGERDSFQSSYFLSFSIMPSRIRSGFDIAPSSSDESGYISGSSSLDGHEPPKIRFTTAHLNFLNRQLQNLEPQGEETTGLALKSAFSSFI